MGHRPLHTNRHAFQRDAAVVDAHGAAWAFNVQDLGGPDFIDLGAMPNGLPRLQLGTACHALFQ
ncbi:hypothetical protein WK39_30515, partial [Burkholderia cepacia]